MSYRTDVAYLYDGTFDGLLTCVFDAYERRESPALIFPASEEQATLFPVREVISDKTKSGRVSTGLRKISPDTLKLVQQSFLTYLPDKEVHILAFIRLAFESGVKAMSMLADDRVAILQKHIIHLGKEADHFKGFVRFTEINGVLTSTIQPKNYVLPIIAPHFANRFPEEDFVIFDKAHGVAALSERGRYKFAYADSIEFDTPSEQELNFQSMWKMFYDTIAIPERFNPRCRMSMMPKRYWTYMSELVSS
jgi:probable DNA metabolism protein